MNHPSRAIYDLVILIATPVAGMVLLQLRGLMKTGVLVREVPLPPLTREQHPIVFFGLVGAGLLGIAVALVGIAWAAYGLLGL